MSYLTMKAELSEAIPGLSRIYAGTLINRAWRVVRDSTLWSFQLRQSSFASPAQVQAGTVTTPVPPSNVILGDATATAAWAAIAPPPFLTQYQFRVSDYSIYNVIGYDTTTYAPFAALLLDRTFVDPVTSPPGNNYQLFQCYYAAPSPTFRRWLSVQDMVNGYALRIWNSRRDLNVLDPQRQITTDPTDILGLGQDTRPGSATIGWPWFELWPVPTSRVSYMTWYVDLGGDLVNNSDTLPSPVGEDVVMLKARVYAYEWAEARRDIMAAKGAGPGYLQLMRDVEQRFEFRLKTLRVLDKDSVDATMAQINSANASGWGLNPFYNSSTMRAGMGWPGRGVWGW